MNTLRALAGGLAGGLVGGAVLLLVYTISDRFSALGGLLVIALAFIGARAASRDGWSTTSRVMGVLMSILFLCAVKSIIFHHRIASAEREIALANFAEVIMDERVRDGDRIVLPPPKDESISYTFEEYPTAVRDEAKLRWREMPADDRPLFGMAPWLFHDDFPIAELAKEKANRIESDGVALEWPPGYGPDSAWLKSHFPAVVWNAAIARWDGMNSEEQEQFRQDQTAEAEDLAQLKLKIGTTLKKFALPYGFLSFRAFELICYLALILLFYVDALGFGGRRQSDVFE
jgi:hypothetical protein